MILPLIDVRTYGSHGQEVVLLHGGPGAQGEMAPLARTLADEFRVLEPLQRRAGEVPLSVAQHVGDLAAVAPEPTVLVGSSWGAMLALSYAAAHSDRVDGVVLVGCGTYDLESRAAYRRNMDARLGAEGLAEIRALEGKLATTTDEAERARTFDALGSRLTRAQAHDPVSTESAVVEVDERGHEETWKDALRLQARGVEPAAFASINAPVVMLHGAQDPHPGPSTYETLRVNIPQLEYVEFERCGHTPWIERHAREPFLAVLRACLRAM